MGKKSKCKSKCDSSSSSSSCDPCSSSSSTFGYCCNKFPKCKCEYGVNKCTPIYYPNNCVGPNPCNPRPCPPPYPCSPCPPPCPPFPPFPCPLPQNCSPYTSAVTTITQSSTTIPLAVNSPNVNVFATSAGLTTLAITLPAINTLNSCNYSKMFVLSNLSGGSSITVNTTSGDLLTNNNTSTFVLAAGSTITIYSVYTGTTNYWAVQA